MASSNHDAISVAEFPRLTPENHRATSPPSDIYNCIAWAMGDTKKWWQPGDYWPNDAISGKGEFEILEQMFKAVGFQDCGMDITVEPNIDKVALYSRLLKYTHAARQLSNGKWTSKLGAGVDVEHDAPNDVAGGIYGDVVQIMKRQRQTQVG